MTAAPTSRAEDVLQRIGMIMMMLVLGPVAVVLTIVSFILCCCCLIPMCLSDDGGFVMTFSVISYLWLMLLTGIALVRDVQRVAHCFAPHRGARSSSSLCATPISPQAILAVPGVVVVAVLALACAPCVILYVNRRAVRGED